MKQYQTLKSMRILFKSVALLLIFSLCGFSSDSSRYKFHRVFIYSFTRYIQWPAEYDQGNFVIGVLGDSPIQASLEEMAQKKSRRGQPFVVQQMKMEEKWQKCHILFVPEERSEALEQVLAKTRRMPTLIITESRGLGRKGSHINFVPKNGKWRFELNKKALEQTGLKVSSDLIRFAIPVS